ncbi:pilus (MSHA type) biogenesis protein MshL [Pontibacterium granulatum]|uniref:pilus (MSHA type) biogenesis protein MshL n=1 Tax=Pontibacterium granulatum TaxID=2036029 RepID=UPI00249A5C61|nr:pilus (MSHA type) biogenesis protein MshL [Pontibacterium granulatum]MDI3325065.1 pilus (MSHA type) biogenesis protein MshL [Pontibacterium granulatum]
MKRLMSVLALSVGVTVSGCSSLDSMNDTAVTDESIAALEEAINVQQQIEAEEQAHSEAAAVAPPPLVPPLDIQTLSQPGEERFDVVADGLSAHDFFMGLVQGTDYNMIVHRDVEGTVNLKLKDVTVDEVMQAMREVYGYEYRRSGKLYQVVPAKLQTEIFQLNYLDIAREGVSDTLVSAGSVRDATSSDSGSGSSDTDSSSSSSSTSVGTRISTKTSANFWVNLKQTLDTLITGDDRRVVVMPQTGMIIVRALPSELHTVREYLNKAELSLHRQVVIEAKILEITLNDKYQAGVNWTALGQPGSSASGKTVTLSQVASSITADGLGGIFRSTFALNDFTAVIELLGRQGDVQVLSSPRVSTINNQKAVIKVGTDEFFVTEVETTTTTGTSTTTTPSVELTPFFSGIALDVTPQISEEGGIVLHIHPTVSEVEDQQKQINIGSDDLSLPLAFSSIRESDSIVRANSGQVIVIGGLMKSENEDQNERTPFLGELPGVGNLFTQRRSVGSKTELVILLRPVLADNDSWQAELERSLRSFQRLRVESTQQ